tara:strand:- start:33 stop:551 length:519 start_codon:yes stop_codon:yes gene_type:complete
MYSENNISKAAFFLGVALFFSSFEFPDWEFNKKYLAKIQTSIVELFVSDSCNFEKFKGVEEDFYTIKEAHIVLGYFVVAKAPSKFHQFDYYIVFDAKTEILKIEVLNYRENYGAEICNKNWLKQFIGLPTENYAKDNRMIDGISGATLSVNNLKQEVFRLSKLLKIHLATKR